MTSPLDKSSPVQLAILVACTAILYSLWLDYSPAYLHDAEVLFGLHARSIALTGYDANGRFLPVYFQMPAIGENVWFHPFLVYWTAPWFWFLPFSEYTTRLPSVAIGSLNVLLAYAIVWKLSGRHYLAMWAAAFMAMTPAHFIHSRLAMDYVHPVPFIMGWLWFLADHDKTRRQRSVLAGCVLLGLGVYSYIASVAMMPLYFLATVAVVAVTRRLTRGLFAKMVVLFVLPLSAAAVWLAMHSAVISETLVRYSVKSSLLNTFWRIRGFVRYSAIQEYIAVYWDFFSPAYLFFAGGSNLQNSTRAAGVFLLPFAVFLVAGIHRAWTTRSNPISAVVLFGFFTAPLAAAFVGERYAIDRHLGTLPFAVLLGVYGLERLQNSGRGMVRAVSAILLIAMPLQFGFFYHDYMTEYRNTSAGAFNYNIKGVAERLIASAAPDTRFFLSRSIMSVRAYWRFALAKTGSESLDERAHVFDPTTVDVAAFPPGSLIAAHVDDATLRRASDHGELRVLASVPEAGRDSVFVIYERQRRD